MPSSFYLGCDVSKGYANFIMLDLQKHIVEPDFQLDDTFEGHQQLFQFFERFFEQTPDATIFTAVESTGGYENNWYLTLCKFKENFSLKVARLNPKGVYHHGQAKLNRLTTDKISAQTIAEYLMNHPEKVLYDQKDPFYNIKRKWNLIQSFIKEKAAKLNQLQNLLYDANPELLVYCKDGLSQWLLKLLRQFPTAKDLVQASVEQLADIPYLSKDRAKKLIESAKSSIASANNIFCADSIMILAQQILDLEITIKKQVQFIVDNCPLPELETLKTFKAIGDLAAIGLLIEIGSIVRFPSVKHLASFFGLHPVFKISGDGTWAMRMSKQGRKAPRAILFMVALAAINHNPHIREIYIENLKKGKSKMDALGVVMHKILRIVYGMLKNNQPYNPEIDQNNRTKFQPQQHTKPIDKSRRFQKHDQNAPISRKQNKKRKEQDQSQNGDTVIHEIKGPALSLH
ncbi:MAG: transposase [Thermodesulfobacteriota bacterium]